MLKAYYQTEWVEAGCDEAGRGCLAGPVYAAAVILPIDYHHPVLTDSKQLSEKLRNQLRRDIEQNAISYAVTAIDNERIDEINILQASISAMHLSLDKLKEKFGYIIIDGNYFKPYGETPYKTIVKGDSLYYSIAAASILSKTYRDEYMEQAQNYILTTTGSAIKVMLLHHIVQPSCSMACAHCTGGHFSSRRCKWIFFEQAFILRPGIIMS